MILEIKIQEYEDAPRTALARVSSVKRRGPRRKIAKIGVYLAESEQSSVNGTLLSFKSGDKELINVRERGRWTTHEIQFSESAFARWFKEAS